MVWGSPERERQRSVQVRGEVQTLSYAEVFKNPGVSPPQPLCKGSLGEAGKRSRLGASLPKLCLFLNLSRMTETEAGLVEEVVGQSGHVSGCVSGPFPDPQVLCSGCPLSQDETLGGETV